MTDIQQIYCTHCTYGSSAIERRDGELAARVLGYSARSSSLDAAELRKSYRHVERFLYYYLPADTPPEEKLRLDASHAPRRLVYYPSINGLQMLGQISYRQQDTVGRPGSYFGHVLFSERGSDPWNVVHCLQLWGAKWIDEDSQELSWDVPALTGLSQLRDGSQPIINDALLLSFLKTPPGKPFDDPDGVIPERWKDKSETEREDLLTDVLIGYLSLGVGANRRESVLLVIEPSLAALIFYGVARLLPAGKLREEISFSTFEPSADRLPVALAATIFYSPTTDLKPEIYRGRGYVNNTFLNKCSERPRAGGAYARVVVKKLLTADWPAVDRVVHGFETAKASTARDLEELAKILELVPTLLDPAAELPQLQWSPVALSYLGHSMRERLAQEPAGSPLLAALVGTSRHLSTLNLIAIDATSTEATEAIQFLLQNLPEERFDALLASDTVARPFKFNALLDFVERNNRFPEPCAALWAASGGNGPKQSNSGASLLADVVSKLPDQALQELASDLPESRSERFLLALIDACRRSPANTSKPHLVAQRLAELNDDQLCRFLINSSSVLSPDKYPKQESTLGKRLPGLLKNLPRHADKFKERLDLLRDWVGHFPDVAEAERRLECWNGLRATLFKLRDAAPSKPSKGFGKSRVDYEETGKKLAEALRGIMPDREYQGDPTGTERVAFLRRLCAVISGQPTVLPDAVWQKIQHYFEYGTWSPAKLSLSSKPLASSRPLPGSRSLARKKESPRKKQGSSTRFLVTACITLLLGMTGIILAFSYLGGQGNVAQQTSAPEAADKPKSNPPSTAATPQVGQNAKAKAETKPKAGSQLAPATQPQQAPESEPVSPPKQSGSDPASMDTVKAPKADPGSPADKPDSSGTPTPTQDNSKPDDKSSPSGEPSSAVEGSESPKTASDPRAALAATEHTEMPTGAVQPVTGTKQGLAANIKPKRARAAADSSPSRKYISPNEYVGLPDTGAKPTTLYTCESEIGNPPFRLHGLTDELSYRPGTGSVANKLIVKWGSSFLAHFVAHGKVVEFQWIPTAIDDKRAALLSACVLEINTSATPSQFIALSMPLALPPAPIASGVATISLESFKRGSTRHQCLAYELGGGILELNGKSHGFGVTPNETQPYVIPDVDKVSAAYISAQMEAGNKSILLKLKGDSTPDAMVIHGCDGGTVSAILYRSIEKDKEGKKISLPIQVEDVIVGNPPTDL